MERKKYGFTMIELLTVIGIIALLVGLLIPALNMVNTMAKEAKQKAQLTAIDLALTAFRNDYGDYPPSDEGPAPYTDVTYCGAQRLAEALLGWDLLGVHPDTHWQADGQNYSDGYFFYDTTNPFDMDKRRGPYLELATTNAFRLGNNPTRQDPDGLFSDTSITSLAPDRFVICDVFGVRRLTLADKRLVTAGTPILYYRANMASMTMVAPSVDLRRYNAYDNSSLVALGSLTRNGQPGDPHLLDGDIENLYLFDHEGGIRDPKITAMPWPYRPDSYILISAGADGEYGTADDITNF